jgi:hypothetical protein
MRSLLFGLVSVAMCLWTATGMYLIRTRQLAILFPYKGRSVAVHVVQGLLALALITALVFFLPAMLILLVAGPMTGRLVLSGAGVWLATFGISGWAFRGLSHPHFQSLPPLEQRRTRARLVLCGALLPSLILGALTSAVALLFLAMPTVFKRALDEPARNLSPEVIALCALVLAVGAFGGYLGYRVWKATASRLLTPALLHAIIAQSVYTRLQDAAATSSSVKDHSRTP